MAKNGALLLAKRWLVCWGKQMCPIEHRLSPFFKLQQKFSFLSVILFISVSLSFRLVERSAYWPRPVEWPSVDPCANPKLKTIRGVFTRWVYCAVIGRIALSIRVKWPLRPPGAVGFGSKGLPTHPFNRAESLFSQ